MEILKEIYKFLVDNNILALLVSLVVSVLSMLIVLVKTRTASIQKKAVSSGNINPSDYIILIDSLRIRLPLSSCRVKLKTLLTKDEQSSYKEVI